jgi:hypothetical protein
MSVHQIGAPICGICREELIPGQTFLSHTPTSSRVHQVATAAMAAQPPSDHVFHEGCLMETIRFAERHGADPSCPYCLADVSVFGSQFKFVSELHQLSRTYSSDRADHLLDLELSDEQAERLLLLAFENKDMSLVIKVSQRYPISERSRNVIIMDMLSVFSDSLSGIRDYRRCIDFCKIFFPLGPVSEDTRMHLLSEIHN